MWLLELEVQVLDCVSTSQIPSKDYQIIYAEVLAFYDFFTVSYVVPCRDNVIGSRWLNVSYLFWSVSYDICQLHEWLSFSVIKILVNKCDA